MCTVEQCRHHDGRDDRHRQHHQRGTTYPNRSDGSQGREHPERADARSHGPARPLLPDVLRDEIVELVQVEGAQHAQHRELGEHAHVLVRVAQRCGALRGAAHRRIAVELPRGVADDAIDHPPGTVAAGERLVAVGAEQGGAVVGGEQHRPIESDHVEHGPGRDHGDRRGGQDRHRDQAVAMVAAGAPDHQPRERDEERELAPRQGGEPDEDTEPCQRCTAARPLRTQEHDQGRHHQQRRQALGHDEAVVHPQVRVHRRDRGRHDSHAGARHVAAEQPDQCHHHDADGGGDEALPGYVVTGPAHRCQHDRGERTVLGTGHVLEDLPEQLPPGELSCLGAVVPRVVQQQRPIPLGHREVPVSPRRASDRHHHQRRHEPRGLAVADRCTRARRRRLVGPGHDRTVSQPRTVEMGTIQRS